MLYGSEIFLHRDKSFMPKNTAAWSAWNFLGTINDKVCVTYWLNILQVCTFFRSNPLTWPSSCFRVVTVRFYENMQNISQTGPPFLVTLNPPSTPEHTLLKWSTGHPIPSVAATKASSQLNLIQGKRRIWFCGAYQGALKQPLKAFSFFTNLICQMPHVHGFFFTLHIFVQAMAFMKMD